MNRNRSTRLALGLAAGIAVLLAALAGWALRPADTTDLASVEDATPAAATQAEGTDDGAAASAEVDTTAPADDAPTAETEDPEPEDPEAENAAAAGDDAEADPDWDDATEGAKADDAKSDDAKSDDAKSDDAKSDDAESDDTAADSGSGSDSTASDAGASNAGASNTGASNTGAGASDAGTSTEAQDEVKSSVVEAPATPAGLSDTPPVVPADTPAPAPLGIGECSLDRLVIYAGAQYSNIGQNLRSALPQTGFGAGCAQPVTVLAANCPLQFSGVLNAGAAYDPNTPYYAASAAVDNESLEKVLGTIADPGAAISPLDFAYAEGDRPGERWVAVFIPPSFDGWQTLAGAAGVAPTPQSQCSATGQVGG